MKSFYLTLPSNVSLHQEEREHAVQELHKSTLAYNELVQRIKAQGEEAQRLSKEIKQTEDSLNDLAEKQPTKKPGKGKTKKEKIEKEEHARFTRAFEPLREDYLEKIRKLEDLKIQRLANKNELLRRKEELIIAESKISETAENTTNEFTIHLPDPIQLDGTGWEVALVEMTYPHSWNNVSEIDAGNAIKVYELNGNENVLTYNVPPSYYDSVETVLKVIKNRLKPEWTEFNYDKVTRRVSISVDRDAKRVELGAQLGYVLGFEIGQSFRPGETIARYPPDLRGGIDSIFIYCNILEPQIIGNTKAPLLRTVGVSGNYGEIVEKIFDSPHYIPLLQRSFSTVKISIYSDQGRPIPFMFGKCIAKLHFRQNKRF